MPRNNIRRNILRLDNEHSVCTFLSVAQAVVDERKLARYVGDEFEDHAAAGGEIERLHAVDGALWWRTEIHGVELLADDVKAAR